MRTIVLSFAFIFMLSSLLLGCNANDKKQANTQSVPVFRVVSSIQPIKALVDTIAGDTVESRLLVPASASPHDYQFKPSDIRKLNKADLVFRIDAQMESLLSAVFNNLDKRSRLISLANAEGIQLQTALGNFHRHRNTLKPSTSNTDFHIWTSPQNALAMAREITRHLSEKNPTSADTYKKRLAAFEQALLKKEAQITQKLSNSKNTPYIVFHNSWQYFAKHFELQPPSVVNLHEGVNSGAKTIHTIRKQIEQQNIRCIFYDNSISKAQLRLLIENRPINSVEIDVLTMNESEENSAYIAWLTQLSDAIKQCLQTK